MEERNADRPKKRQHVDRTENRQRRRNECGGVRARAARWLPLRNSRDRDCAHRVRTSFLHAADVLAANAPHCERVTLDWAHVASPRRLFRSLDFNPALLTASCEDYGKIPLA